MKMTARMGGRWSIGSRSWWLRVVAVAGCVGVAGLLGQAFGQSSRPPAWWPGINTFSAYSGSGAGCPPQTPDWAVASCRSASLKARPNPSKDSYLELFAEFRRNGEVGTVALRIIAKARTLAPGIGTRDSPIDRDRGNFIGEAWNEISCDGASAIFAETMRASPVAVRPDVSKLTCEFSQEPIPSLNSDMPSVIRVIRIEAPALFGSTASKVSAPVTRSCDTALIGDWKSDAPVHVKKGLTLKLKPQEDRMTLLEGTFAARGQYKYEIGSGLSPAGVWSFADPVRSGDTCTFRIKPSPLASAGDWTLRYNTKTDSFSFFKGNVGATYPDPFLPGRWTRGSPPKPAATCSKDDINGTWHRADGARVLMTGVGVFGNGGHAIMDRYPEDRWPKGESKFRAVKEVAACRYEARCTTVTSRKSSDGYSYDVKDAACTLMVDPAKRVMTASGTHGVYTRVAPNAAAERAAQAREAAEATKAREAAAEAERTARLNREVAERDAAIKRRNAETKAADDRRQREYLQALAAQKAEADRIKREAAAAKARYEAEMAAWRARVAACNAGDYTQCQ